MWALTTRHATLSEAYRHFSYRSVRGLDSYHYSVKELKACVVHYSISDFILSEINQELIVRISGLTGSQFILPSTYFMITLFVLFLVGSQTHA
jgi:hypothetical protein